MSIKNHNFFLVCCRQFSNKLNAEKHKTSQSHQFQIKRRQISSGEAIESYSCFICGESTNNLNDHLIQNHPKEASQCCVCGQLFAMPQQLSAHMRQKRCKSVKSRSEEQYSSALLLKDGLPCHLCSGFVAKTQDLLLLHSTIVHSDFSRLDCIVCKAGPYSSRSKLLLHLITHDSEDKQIRCNACSTLFRSVSSAQNHSCSSAETPNSNSPTTSSKQLFQCSQCDYSTKKASSYKSHQTTHQTEDQRPKIICQICKNFKCSRMSELRRHIKIRHHRATREEKLHCDQCDYSRYVFNFCVK